MSSNCNRNPLLACDLLDKQTRHEELTQQILVINVDLQKITLQFNTEANRIQSRITKIQFSRPRGNPANYWPHRPMTNRIHLFYQAKEKKESSIRHNKEMLKLTFEHDRAILTSLKLVLINKQSDLTSQIRLIRIRLGLPI